MSDRWYSLTQDWTAPISSRFLIEGGISVYYADWAGNPQHEAIAPSATDQGTGFTFRSRAGGGRGGYRITNYRNHAARFTASCTSRVLMPFRLYFIANPGQITLDFYHINDDNVTLLSGSPRQVLYLPTLYFNRDYFNKFAVCTRPMDHPST